MALTEEKIVDKITVNGELKTINVRVASVIKKDGVEITRTFERHVVAPNISEDDLAKEDADVQAIAKQVHTDAVKKAYIAKVEESK